MQQVANESMQAWKEAATEHFELKEAATEHFELHCMFHVGVPYMTIYIHGKIHCYRACICNAGNAMRTITILSRRCNALLQSMQMP